MAGRGGVVSALVMPSDEVRRALDAGDAVVALETSVLSQGLPVPRNADAARAMSAEAREQGAVPAWIGVVSGGVRVGLSETELERFCDPRDIVKVTRRDLPMVVAGGGLGATTVSTTIWAARAAGIRVGATGGIGGVHLGTGDVSADLLELARTPVVLVCSGPKSIVDPVATAERLEELGVAMVGYGVDRMPFFLAREAALELEHRADTPAQIAAVARAQRELGTRSAVLVCNPVPASHALDAEVVAQAVRRAEARAEREGVRGKAVTPFLLSALSEETGGASLEANLALLRSNARLAAEVAAALAGGAP
ncbi:MAG TPA: pseudouridine-5'-phosphate glycosidase [Actinomycetota bacterium]|nr:pseudouridine-5'-phosphate glycosidase [Actinomycetota bacterium]